MKYQNLEELKENSKESFKELKGAMNDFKKEILSHEKIKLPKGFDIDVQIKSGQDIRDIAIDEIVIRIKEDMRDDGKTKYFWTTDDLVEFKFRDNELIKYDARSVHGGYNSKEYKDYENGKEISPIEISELMIKLNLVQFNLMKIATQNPELLLQPLATYKNAEIKHEKSRDLYSTELNRLKTIERESQMDDIREGLTTINPKLLDQVKSKLRSGENYEDSISFVVLDEPNSLHDNQVQIKEVKVICKKGGKTTYAMSECKSSPTPMKGADVSNLISQAIVLDGEILTSINDFKSKVSSDLDGKLSSRDSLFSVSVEDMSEVAKTLIEKNISLEQKKSSKNKSRPSTPRPQ